VVGFGELCLEKGSCLAVILLGNRVAGKISSGKRRMGSGGRGKEGMFAVCMGPGGEMCCGLLASPLTVEVTRKGRG